jgi:hypothetical protein
MSEIARLREEVSARKFKVMNLDIEIDRRVREIRGLIGTTLTPNRNIMLRLVAQRATETANLQDERLAIIEEIRLGEMEING